MQMVQPLRLTARDLREQDLLECFRLDPKRFGEEIVGFEKAFAVWKRLAGTRAFKGTVIELEQPDGSRMVGFGARVFVSRDFVESEVARPRPGLYARLVAAVDACQPVILGLSQIRRANTYHGLDLVVLMSLSYRLLPAEAYPTAAALMASQFLEDHASYWLRQNILEIANEDMKAVTDSAVFRIVSDFGDGSLVTITKEDVLGVIGHPLSAPFLPKKPQLRLRDADQYFLKAAARGLTDEELSSTLDLSVSAVKKRWLTLFDRIAETQPTFFPESSSAHGQTRGRQKRHVLIAYVRAHPEELAPFEW